MIIYKKSDKIKKKSFYKYNRGRQAMGYSWKQKRKLWHEAQIRKQHRKLHKHHHHRKKQLSFSANVSVRKKYPVEEGQRKLIVPQSFSLFGDENAETLQFFNKVIELFSASQSKDVIFFDFSHVEKISVDAIMYFIALLHNTWRIQYFNVKCTGNAPQNIVARQLMEEAGFFDYLTPVYPHSSKKNSHYVRISHGTVADGVLAGMICDFVNDASKTSRLNTKRLFPMIVELMTNTHQHAYGKSKSSMLTHWYIFAQELDDKVQFVFLDTGIGIPKTVFKRFKEKAKNLLISLDSEYLSSVLRGDFRTETRKKHRGKGLPGIYCDVCKGALSEFSVISGRGMCTVKQDGEIVPTTLAHEFMGTLFVWTVKKHREVFQ